MKTVAVLSMLHEPAEHNSATRRFRGEAILSRVVRRVRAAAGIERAVVLLRPDQNVSQQVDADVRAGDASPAIAASTAARRWADGWRGGPLATCWFDRGFDARRILEASGDADAALLVDPASAFVDPSLLADLIAAAGSHDLVFSQAAPGLSGVVLRRSLLQRLAESGTSPGRLLHYQPELPQPDPIGRDFCVRVPTLVARSRRSFLVDTDRCLRNAEKWTALLNGTLDSSTAERIVQTAEAFAAFDLFPRDVTIELTTRRATSPRFLPAADSLIRDEIPVAQWTPLFREIAEHGARLTLAGIGDPMMSPDFEATLDAARSAGVESIAVWTDLLPTNSAMIDALVRHRVDIVSVHLPAGTRATYTRMMGVDQINDVADNLKQIIARKAAERAGVPIVVPVFTKCVDNAAEMEEWYDHWLRQLGSATIAGPTTFAGLIHDQSVADMSPPMRVACRRLERRATVLCDGRVTLCDEDATGRNAVGSILNRPLSQWWQTAFDTTRKLHTLGRWSSISTCANCKEWHRP